MKVLTLAIILVTTSFLASPAFAGTTHPWEASLGLGAQFGGTSTIENGSSVEVDGESGFAMKLGVDYFPSEYFGVGPVLTYGSSYTGRDGNINIIEFGLEIKGRVPFHDLVGEGDLLITPELGLVYRRSMPEFKLAQDGLGINFGLDCRLRWRSFEVFVEPGFVTQPAGGNELYNVTFGPIGYVMVGVGIPWGGGGDENF